MPETTATTGEAPPALTAAKLRMLMLQLGPPLPDIRVSALCPPGTAYEIWDPIDKRHIIFCNAEDYKKVV